MNKEKIRGIDAPLYDEIIKHMKEIKPDIDSDEAEERAKSLMQDLVSTARDIRKKINEANICIE